jgi:molybdopterin/thiamine biosynthesis adenylyltransferase
VKTTIHIAGDDFAAVHQHLFPGDRDEHGAIMLAGIDDRGGARRLLVREVELLDEMDFPPGRYGYRQLAAHRIAELGTRAGDGGLALITAHSHPGATTSVYFSSDDLDSHARLFPHLLDVTDGNPVAGLVLGQASAAGEVWEPGPISEKITGLAVLGSPIRHLQAQPTSKPANHDTRFDRQVRLFGAEGQQILRGMHVGVVGAGGGGSMLVEQLAHLGVGEITVIDFDIVKAHNLSRIVGATRRDAARRRRKIEVAKRLVRGIDPAIRINAVDGDIADIAVAKQLLECDFLFLATDTATSRHVFNAIVHTFFIPGVQIGAKVEIRPATEEIEEIYVAVRPVFPGQGCLHCANVIDPMALQEEARTDVERIAQNYLNTPEVVDPSVMTLNGLAASEGMNLFLLAAVGLGQPELLHHRLYFPARGEMLSVEPQRQASCRWCGRGARSAFATADVERLPCRRGFAAQRARWWRRLMHQSD